MVRLMEMVVEGFFFFTSFFSATYVFFPYFFPSPLALRVTLSAVTDVWCSVPSLPPLKDDDLEKFLLYEGSVLLPIRSQFLVSILTTIVMLIFIISFFLSSVSHS
jgi:hypothetical protein